MYWTVSCCTGQYKLEDTAGVKILDSINSLAENTGQVRWTWVPLQAREVRNTEGLHLYEIEAILLKKEQF